MPRGKSTSGAACGAASKPPMPTRPHRPRCCNRPTQRAGRTARNYFELRGTQRELRIARADIAAAAESLELVQARADGGLVTDLDPVRQRALVAELRARIPALLQQEAEAMNRITLLAGAAPGALNTELPTPQPTALSAMCRTPPCPTSRSACLRTWPAPPRHRAAEAQLHAATARIGVAVADLYPRVTLGAGFGYESVGSDRFGEWGSRQWHVGPSISLPIFDNGRRRSTVDLRELQQQEAAVAFQQTVLKAWHEIDAALNAYSAERQRHAELAERERQSRDALTLAHARYANGLTDFGVELDARRVLLQAQRDQRAEHEPAVREFGHGLQGARWWHATNRRGGAAHAPSVIVKNCPNNRHSLQRGKAPSYEAQI
jgi:outer membrane protein TolC